MFAIMRSIAVVIFGGILHTFYAAKILGLEWSYVWICCRSPLLASLFLAISLIGLNKIFWSGPLWFSLVLRMMLGLASYLIGLFLFDKNFLLGFFRSH